MFHVMQGTHRVITYRAIIVVFLTLWYVITVHGYTNLTLLPAEMMEIMTVTSGLGSSWSSPSSLSLVFWHFLMVS